MTTIRSVVPAALVIASLCLRAASVSAQDLEPRAYIPAPTGMTVVIGAVGFSRGGVLSDPTLPVDNIKATITSVSGAVAQTFGLFGRQAQAVVAFPVAWLEASGDINEETRSVSRTGLTDARLKLAVNLHGSPARTLQEFVKAPRAAYVLGASLLVAPPAGQYDKNKLVNLGANRWSFKPELGFSFPRGRWDFDLYSGVWLFTTNDYFYPGTAVRSQDPIVTLQAHVSYNISPAAWAAFDSTWYRGGQTQVNDVLKADLQRNSRLGATVALPAGKRSSVKISVSTGFTTRIGGDFDSIGVAWQTLFR